MGGRFWNLALHSLECAVCTRLAELPTPATYTGTSAPYYLQILISKYSVAQIDCCPPSPSNCSVCVCMYVCVCVHSRGSAAFGSARECRQWQMRHTPVATRQPVTEHSTTVACHDEHYNSWGDEAAPALGTHKQAGKDRERQSSFIWKSAVEEFSSGSCVLAAAPFSISIASFRLIGLTSSSLVQTNSSLFLPCTSLAVLWQHFA